MKKELNYATAKERLEEILASLESGELDVDSLTANIKEATELIDSCKKRLRAIEKELDKSLKEE